ncbi:DUF2516 family protein [Corynebacterium sp. 320]|uniref:DUF2516 family protein n=1 Tax=Corynebacterium zhongnanshanii TaxID=2768834 RepID=A0ABQ6VER1_9CORY|nr:MULTISPECIES: DUF2516 family protein [Corynebacterium]KAB1504445.1 DUF2516 family protein [Corynebacterium sp. 320]KAB1552456.1 DUF2516 family protein [Corynebacterium sp. 321]KAB1554329.1 DUF2516 family protein [Corynebacterium sp. 319]KAB3522699.1 DUF2516 family protein [Corynebacterium zhongnanshanii]KAB3528581.1 DUF2516 family protein [Corynebacterium sp. 250]
MSVVLTGLWYVLFGLNAAAGLLVLAFAVVGGVQIAITRDDAFMVIDRQKQNWLMLMGGALVLVVLSFLPGLQMLWIIAAVIVGVYWQDVRPSLRDVLDNASGSW